MSNQYDSDIEVIASHLCIGERSNHTVCPKCLGGGSGEASLLIWADPSCLTYKCYRVACGLFGRTGVSGHRQMATKKRKPLTSITTLNPSPLPQDVVDCMTDMFPWLSRQLMILNSVQWEDKKERIVYPIRSLTGTDEGLLVRKYDVLILDESNLQGIKAKTYWRDMDEDYTLTSLMPPRGADRSDKIVLVEDYPSAMRLNEDVPCTAMSGTSLQDAALMNIIRSGVKHIVIVLDADATTKAAKMAHQYRPFFHSMAFVPLADLDPKDMNDEDYTSLVTQINERLA